MQFSRLENCESMVKWNAWIHLWGLYLKSVCIISQTPCDSTSLFKFPFPLCVSLNASTVAPRSSSPPVKLYKHRIDVTEGSGTSYGELPADIAMSYKPIAPAPTGSNHTPPGLNVISLHCRLRGAGTMGSCEGILVQYRTAWHSAPGSERNVKAASVCMEADKLSQLSSFTQLTWRRWACQH